ncbi:MAG: MBOAT family protein [Bacteroidota bacterium]
MLFNSLDFLIFFPIVVGLYYAMPARYRWLMLLGASYYFYMCWKAEYIILIVLSTLIDYGVSLKMSSIEEKKKRLPCLLISLCANLGLLFFFKYWTFFSSNTQAVLDQLNIFYDLPAFDLLLPVGISFYTFQTLSYSIDIYQGKIQPERHLGRFALYVSFFPQLVAGPIERASRLLPQFHQTFQFDYHRVVGGVQQMMWGMFKKVVIADRLAAYVTEIYALPAEENGLALLIATYFFAFQIYCDFSGYSDIAIGAARVLGYDLMDNFRTPYLAASVREFWARWHISLSTWFRDYVYIPLGGNRVRTGRWFANLMIVFVVSGFWHGANWTFIVWGALHGAYLIAEILAKRWNLFHLNWLAPRLRRGVMILTTFHLTLLAWVFFRANNLQDAWTILSSIIQLPLSLTLAMIKETVIGAGGLSWGISCMILLGFILLDPILDQRIKGLKANQRIPAARLVFASLTSLILLCGYFGKVEFIYFQF